MDKKINFKDDLIKAILILSPLIIYSIFQGFVQTIFYDDCSTQDVYEISDWTACTEEGFRYRDVEIRSMLRCNNSENVKRPISKELCEYSPVCNPEVDICSDNYTYLFKEDVKEYTTIIYNENYSVENHNNLLINAVGAFESITLKVVPDLYPVRTDEFYYIFFALGREGEYPIPRILETSRLSSNRIDTKAYGVFQGVSMPDVLTFDLGSLKLAKSSKEGLGDITKNYLEYLNDNSGGSFVSTLYLADGKSMVTSDLSKRIYGTIKTAWFEYNCMENSECSISRIPEI